MYKVGRLAGEVLRRVPGFHTAVREVQAAARTKWGARALSVLRSSRAWLAAVVLWWIFLGPENIVFRMFFLSIAVVIVWVIRNPKLLAKLNRPVPGTRRGRRRRGRGVLLFVLTAGLSGLAKATKPKRRNIYRDWGTGG